MRSQCTKTWRLVPSSEKFQLRYFVISSQIPETEQFVTTREDIGDFFNSVEISIQNKFVVILELRICDMRSQCTKTWRLVPSSEKFQLRYFVSSELMFLT